ncbi:MAG TPA: S8 family serine peptidase [Archangium sp.]|nr:S8 family serine peptidase [Archangium sp.]
MRFIAQWRPLVASITSLMLVTPLPVIAAATLAPNTQADKKWQEPARIIEVGGNTPGKSVHGNMNASEWGRYTLVTGAGVAFHRTAQPIHALQTVNVHDSSRQLHTWEEEQPDGHRASFYAYSQDGQLSGRVRTTDYLLRLQQKQFDPLRDPGSMATSLLTADSANRLHLVQFLASPLPEFRETIEGMGGKILRFLSDHTYLVDMDRDVHARVSKLPYVRWVGDYHPEYRLEPSLKAALLGMAPQLPDAQRYSIMLGERGEARQRQVVDLVRKLGGKVELVEPGGLRVEATLTQDQLYHVVRANEVQFIDRWGGPGEVDMDIVRETGGANYIEGLRGWSGQGVRGEIFDTELLVSHQEWPTPPLVHSTGTTGSLHGTSCYSHNFAQGIQPGARGLLRDGQGIFFRYSESTQFGGTKSRYTINQELTNPYGPYRAVFQTSSVGSAQTTLYTTVSAEVDDYLFRHPILSTQSQSNMGNRYSRPQAWAKNIVSVGGIRHLNTLSRTDDSWSYGGSIGPAEDGRIKPDLAFFYDSVRGASGSGNTSYTEFGGTSSATPQTAGYFGLLFQMWHEGVWTGHGHKADVFTSRPKMSTAKALMINSAWRYNWLAGGSNADLDRYKQGWGSADLKHLYERAPKTSVIDETDIIKPLEIKTYKVNVLPGEAELNVTMTYTDPMGTVGAARARINDLSLRVTSPTGTVYWGNNGLTSSNFSTPGGASNTVDTVENVFIQSPIPGGWKVEILGDEIVQDAHLETTEVDADYALVVSGGLIQTPEDPCAGASGSGIYKGYTCEDANNFIVAEGLSCQDARRKCELNASSSPRTSFFCTWNDRVVYRKEGTPGVCNPLVCEAILGTGRQEGYICGSHRFMITDNSPCQDAVDVCALNAETNPSVSFLCTWKGTEVYRKERVAGACQNLP